MCLNGVQIGMGMEIIHQVHQIIPPDQSQALIACFVEAVGPAMRGTVVWLIVATILPTIATTTVAFG